MCSFGGPGRGSHQAALDASLAVFGARQAVSNLLGGWGAASVSFAMNATMALNIAIDGLLSEGGCAVTTAASHNSVLRPLFRARDERGCTVRIARITPDGALDWDDYQRSLEGASLVAATHASTLQATCTMSRAWRCMAHSKGRCSLLDAAQTAGAWPLNVAKQAPMPCVSPAIKSLQPLGGTGGLIVRPVLRSRRCSKRVGRP